MKKTYEFPQIEVFRLWKDDIVTSSATQPPNSLQNGGAGTGDNGSFGELFG